jgi:hypothetical protein
MRDADAVQMAQELPENFASVTRPFSILRAREISSPQRAL